MSATAAITVRSAQEPVESSPAAVTAVLSAMALVVLDATMVTIAVPTIAEDMAVAPAKALGVVSVYQTALVMALLPFAAIGESIGNRRVFVGGVAVFGAAAGFGAFASSLEQLLAARFVQGVGGAAIMALGIALLRQVLPGERFGAAISWNALTVALCSGSGPTLGALIISMGKWQWLLLAHTPLALIAALSALCVRSPAGTGRRIDLASIILCAAASASLMFGAQAIPAYPASACLLIVTSAGLFWTLIRRERQRKAPLVPLDLLRLTTFRRSVLASIFCFTGQTAGMLALPFHLQNTFDQTPLMTGFYMTSWPLAVALAAALVSRLHAPSRLLCAGGGTLIAAGLASAAMLPAEAGPGWLAASIIPCGLGFGLFQVPNNRTMFLSAPVERSAAAGGMQGTARLTGQTFGSILVAMLFAMGPSLSSPRLAMAIGAALALLSAMISMAPARAGTAEGNRND